MKLTCALPLVHNIITIDTIDTSKYSLLGAIVVVMLARPLHVSKVGQSKEKGKIKQATLKSDFHAYGNESFLWPKRLGR